MTPEEFLKENRLDPAGIDVDEISDRIAANMKSGLAGSPVDMPMFKAYLTNDGEVPKNIQAAVIDAGGTNYRCALASFSDEGCTVSDLFTSKMPGTDKPVTWEEFISFVADTLVPIIDRAGVIGFCFSYSASITPDMDAVVDTIDKEVKITGCEGKLIAESLLSELSGRGITGKKCVILNDTVAALLGGSSSIDKSLYSDFIGMICGTGLNTCMSYNGMLINCESGMFKEVPQGPFDIELDRESVQPGEKLLEKMCSGAYLGTLAKKALGLEGNPNGADVDRLAGEGSELEQAVCKALFERSAKLAAAIIIAIMKVNSSGMDKPCCVVAEGSLIGKSRYFLPYLEKALEENAGERRVEIVVGHDTTLPGSAAAALINT